MIFLTEILNPQIRIEIVWKLLSTRDPDWELQRIWLNATSQTFLHFVPRKNLFKWPSLLNLSAIFMSMKQNPLKACLFATRDHNISRSQFDTSVKWRINSKHVSHYFCSIWHFGVSCSLFGHQYFFSWRTCSFFWWQQQWIRQEILFQCKTVSSTFFYA